MHNSHKTSPSPKTQEFDFVAKTVLNIDVALLLEKFRLELLHNFSNFSSMPLLERSMSFFCGLGVSKWVVLLVLSRFAINFPVLGKAQKSDEV